MAQAYTETNFEGDSLTVTAAGTESGIDWDALTLNERISLAGDLLSNAKEVRETVVIKRYSDIRNSATLQMSDYDLTTDVRGYAYQQFSEAQEMTGELAQQRAVLAAQLNALNALLAAVEDARKQWADTATGTGAYYDAKNLYEAAKAGCVDPVALARWAETPSRAGARSDRLVLWALTALGIAGAAAFLLLDAALVGAVRLSQTAFGLTRDIFLVTLVVNGIYLYRNRNRVAQVVAEVDEAAHELKLLSETLVRLEREQFKSALLAGLRASLNAAGDPPSRRMARLGRLTDYLDSRDHVLIRVAEIFVLWTNHLALAVEAWRAKSGKAVRNWLTATGEIEALCSLASYAFENPSDPFPEFLAEGPFVEAEAMGHPLIPRERLVRNDLKLGNGLRVLVVSGSNMSGKSTMLRTLGINVTLAQAGAPVRAKSLHLSPLAVGASIRVTDSLQDGISRFYAEILRLRQILDQTSQGLPVLFLVDEFLNGTNSHDRRIGAEALVRGLVERGAIGLITTHDLALADIANALGERAANVHFEDRIEDGRIVFDYVMRPGVVRKSNAIELMRSVGLEI
jgi:hypothetical protein